MSLAVFESEASISICTGELTPRAMSRPKRAGIISAARATFEVNAVSGCRSTENGTMWKVFDCPEGVDQGARSGRIVEILHRDRKIGDRERNRGSHEDELRQRQHQRETERHLVANDLGQFFACLGQNSSHRDHSSTATLPSCRAFSTTLMKTSSSEKRPSLTLMTCTPFASSFCAVLFVRPSRRRPR